MWASVQEFWTRWSQWPAAAVIATGLVAGITWGVVARLWMRLISTDPAFTWSGSLFIVGAFGVAGASQAISLVARRRSSSVRRGGRLIGMVGMLPLFMAGGSPLLPTILGGGLAIGQRSWPRPIRALAAIAAAVPVVIITIALADDFGVGVRLLAGALGLIVVYTGIAAAVSVSLGRAPDVAPLPRALRIAAIAAGVLVLLMATVGLAGLRGSASG